MNNFISVSSVLFAASLIYCKRNFIVISPRIFDVGEKETIQVNVIDIPKPGDVWVRLINNNGRVFSEVRHYFEKEGSKELELYVPSHLANNRYNYNSNYRLQVIGDFGDYKFEKNETIQIRSIKELVFLNTDKPFYKAGQTVNFRVLIINSDLNPLEKNPRGNIWITDENKIRVAQWTNITFIQGLIHQKLELPDEPVLGNWRLHVEVNKIYTTKDFEIKEYVLPTFYVTITPPPYYVNKQENLKWTVCAKYTFGKPVQGMLRAKIQFSSNDYKSSHLYGQGPINGCAKPNLDSSHKLLTEYRQHSHPSLKFSAEVTEEGTGIKVKASSDTYLSFHKYIISRDDNRQYFKPSIPIRMKITIRTPDNKSVVNETLSICATMKRENRKKNRKIIVTVNMCKEYISNENGKIFITIPPQPSNILDMSFEVKGKETEARILRFSLRQWFSATGHNLQIEPISSAIECGKSAEITVLYTSNGPETRKLYYQVASKGDIIEAGFKQYTFHPKDDLSNQRDETYLDSVYELVCQGEDWDNKFPTMKYLGKFTFDLNVTIKKSPKAQLIMYSVTKDGNIYADSVSFEVKPCFKHQVEIKFIDQKQFPGAQTTIQLSAAPQSLCSIGVIDKSAYLLHEIDGLTKSKAYNILKLLDTSPYQMTSDHCWKNNQSLDPLSLDAVTAFTKAGLLIFSDLELETSPSFLGGFACKSFPSDVAYTFPENSLNSGSTGSLEKLLSDYFPETWIWDIQYINSNGKLSLKVNMPDSITEWEGNAVCVHHDAGLGISDEASIVAFQPFFTSLTLPYSIVRGEILPVVTTVFNYLEDCLPIRITLNQTEDFEIYNGTFFSKKCICADKSVRKTFFIKPKTLGTINITVTAATIKDKRVCENSDIADISRSDFSTKPLVIEAEGFPKEDVKNIFFCMEDVSKDSFKAEHELLRSDDVVEGSDRAYVFVTGDVMGRTVEGLGGLVKEPTGNGERNMITLIRNIVVLDYLGSTDRLNENIKEKAVNSIKEGYSRQQQFRHPDASYSDLGTRDPSGSLWLTAFVIRSFARASKYVNIDQTGLERSRGWIISHQLENGCFPGIGKVQQKNMKGGVGKGSPERLTAYVTCALLESGNVRDIVIAKAKKCIQAHYNPSNYDLAIFAYMATLTNDLDVEKYLEQLLKKAVTKGFSMYWENKDKALAIETASYAMLALLKSPNEEHFRKVGPIARWLSFQRRSYGGFMFIQDTIMAIQALAEYAVRINRHDLKMALTISSKDLIKSFELNEENELLTQRTRLPILPTRVEVEAVGHGCALAQIVHRYNSPNKEVNKNFVLSIQAERKEGVCQTASIGICVSLGKAETESKMVILEIKMVSGFEVDKGSVEKLKSVSELEINRIDIKHKLIKLYFTLLIDHKICFSFDVHEKIAIEHKQPAFAKVYDHYNKDDEATVSYSITDECKILK